MNILTIITNENQTMRLIGYCNPKNKRTFENALVYPSLTPVEVEIRIDEVQITTVNGGIIILKGIK